MSRRSRLRRAGAFDPARAARVLDRVATLVAAGVPPPRAWELVGGVPGGGSPGGVASAVVVGGAAADVVGSAPPAAADVALVLRVADRTGAPVAETLGALARALRRSAASDRAIRVALAGPRTSARVVLALPFFGIGLDAAWGSGAVQVLVGSPLGWTCSGLAALLVLLGRAWTARLVRAATPAGRIPGVVLDAWAVAVSGGGSWISAGEAVRRAADGVVPPEADLLRLREVLDLARRAGVPAAGLLRRAADDVRDDAAAAGLAAAERLAVRLVLPLGVCVLPAFVLVGVVPVVVGVLSSTVVGVR